MREDFETNFSLSAKKTNVYSVFMINSNDSSASITGVLLVNLGTPDSPSVPDVRKYLRQFLMDGRVIDVPAALRFVLVNGIIAPFRAPKSAKTYKEVWMPEGKGSPLKYYGMATEKLLADELGQGYYVRLAMRYQSPSIPGVLADMKKQNVDRLIVIPLFPQYASASTGSVAEEVMRVATTWQTIPTISIINQFFARPDFIEAFAERTKAKLAEADYDHLLLTYHGLPERHIRKGDDHKVCQLGACCDSISGSNQWCYRAQCFATSRALLEAVGWPVEKATTTFQSRLGSDPWIKPYTDKVLKELAEKGVKRVLAVSPSFVADCLETVIEIGDEYRELFEEYGGEHVELVPSLNDSPAWIAMLKALVLENQGSYTGKAAHLAAI